MPRAEQQPQVEPYLPNLDESRYSSSVERGLAILSCFTPQRPVLGIKEISIELGMSPSTSHRYVSTLAELGYLEQGPRRKYRLTLAVTRLGMSALNATSLREHAAESIAVNDQELAPGLHAIAAAVRDHIGVVAAICIADDLSLISLEGMVEHLTPHLRSTADRISARLGYRRRDELHPEATYPS